MGTVANEAWFCFLLLLLTVFISLILAVRGLLCCTGVFSACGRRLQVQCRLLLAVASDRGAQASVGTPGLESTASIVAVPGLSCPAACGVLPAQGWNPCLLLWEKGCLPLSLQESPKP